MMNNNTTRRLERKMNHGPTKAIALTIVCLLVATLASCAAGANDLLGTSRIEGEAPAGFILGLWHGLIAFIAFVISLFNKNVSVYEVHNTGVTYNLGYIIGLAIAFGGSVKGTRRNRKKDCH